MKKLIVVFLVVFLTSCIVAPFGGFGHGRGYHGNYGGHGRR